MRMRRLLIAVVALVAVLVVADRVAVIAAQRDVARRIEVDQHLSDAPSVTIGGFPFLTQLIGGTYDDVTVELRGLHVSGVRVSRLTAHLHGAHVSFHDVVTQHVSRVPIDRATAQVVLTYADLDAMLAQQTGVQPARHLDAHVVTSASVEAGDRVVLHTSFGADVTVSLTGLPFGVRLVAVKVTQSGLELNGSAAGLVLRP